MMDEMANKARVALVTGGGRRVGKGISNALAEAGYHVILHYGRSRQEAEATARELAAGGASVDSLGADLADVEQIEAMFSAVEKRCGRLDLLVNSAASFLKQPLGEIGVDDWDRTMAVNLRAAFACTQQAVRLLRIGAESTGVASSVINIADLSGVLAWPGYSHHGVSKAGLLHLTRQNARELAPTIRVNALVLGPILPPPGADATDPGWQGLIDLLPVGRPGQLSEVGASVVFLAANGFITGEAILLDGGEHLLGAGHRR